MGLGISPTISIDSTSGFSPTVGTGREQHFRIWVAHALKQILLGAALHQRAQVHNAKTVADMLDDG